MATTEDEKIEVSFEGGKVLVDIDLSRGAWAFDLSLGECVVLIEKLTQVVIDAAMASPD